MDLEQLKVSYEVIQYSIEEDLADIVLPYQKCEELGGILSRLETFYRIRGLLKFLLDADVDGFFEDLNREALTCLTVLKAYHSKMDVADEFVWSPYYPLLCAIAVTNFAAVQEMDDLLPEEKDIYDTEEAFAVTMMLRKLVARGKQEITNTFHHLKSVCEGRGQYGHMIKIMQGLISEETEIFNEGLLEYLQSFDTITPEEAEEMRPGEEYVSIEALAFIQLAKRKNIPITVTHTMIPPELQDARLIIPKLGYPAWPG
jgi:hypothetical protein